MNTDITYCPANSTSCYMLKTSTQSYANAQSYCSGLGGIVVACALLVSYSALVLLEHTQLRTSAQRLRAGCLFRIFYIEYL